MLLHTQLSVNPCYCTHRFIAHPCYCIHSSVHAHVTAHTAQWAPMLLHTQLLCIPLLLHTQVQVSLSSKYRTGTPYTVCVVWLHNAKEPACNTSLDSNIWHDMNCSVFLHTQHFLLLQKHNCLIMKTKSLKCLYHHSSACKSQIATSWIILC